MSLQLQNPTNQQTLISHLVEFRSRLVKCVFFIAGGAVIGLIYCQQIYHWLQIPLLKALGDTGNFIATNPFESYVTYFKVSIFAGLFMVSPLLFYHFWAFITPGLEKKEKKLLLPFALISAVLFVSGAIFGYFVVFPAGFYYMNLILQGTGIKLMPSMSQYLSIAFTMLFSFGVAFELPLVIFLLGKLGLITYDTIKSIRRYIIVILFVVAAVLTPGPDILSQCLLAVPLWLLYEVGGLSLKLIKK
ncbi:MAG: hypothetical protein ACD_73C00630G0002 [uncultured bacterium]|nr:MAG: hypothetical protein ACD_73C00630G0002 [uncultured bacterium]